MITPRVLAPARALVLIAPFAFGVVLADRIPDGFDDAARDGALWLEQESPNPSGCRAREFGGKLRFESGGVGSAASYAFRKRIDWNDGFVVDWSQYASISLPAAANRSGRSGLAFGWGAFDPFSGFQDGINIEIIRTASTRRMVLSVRRGGSVVDSAWTSVGGGESSYRMVCSVGFGVSVDVFRNDGISPILSLDGVDMTFSNRSASGMSMAFLAWAHSGVTMDCRFDGFRFWGDQFDDSDDRLADDSDSADDDDDKDGYDDSPDGDDDGDDNVARSVTVAQFNAALTAALAASPLPVLEAEVERQGSTSLVSVLQWNAAASRLVEVRVNAATGAVVASRTWTPSAMQLANYQDKIDALGAVTVQVRNAVSAAVTGGATVSEVELESEDAGPVWKVKFVTPAGVEDESEVDAS
jgi:uncharacterized membrane protein YkoI